MTDKKEGSYEDRFALKVKPDTRMRQVRFFKKEVVEKLKKMNLKEKKVSI